MHVQGVVKCGERSVDDRERADSSRAVLQGIYQIEEVFGFFCEIDRHEFRLYRTVACVGRIKTGIEAAKRTGGIKDKVGRQQRF